MYTAFYKFSSRPFQLTPDPRFYFDTRSHKKAMAYLTFGLGQGEGFIIITGDIGAGKTTLVGHLLDELDRDKIIAGNVVTTHLDADNILRMVATAFGLPQEGRDKASLLKSIEGFLHSSHRRGKRVLLIVDEAQNLPSAALEELRMLSNFQLNDKPLLQCFLLGQPQFRERLAVDPDLEQLNQRAIATYHLEPMAGYDEVKLYVMHRLQLVGWRSDPTFDDGAFNRIYEYTDGVPRRINTFCSRLLLFGYLEELHAIDEKVVNDVIADIEGEYSSVNEVVAPLRKKRNAARRHLGEQTPAGNSQADEEQNGVVATAAGEAALSEIIARLDTLEKYVSAHDRMIRKTVDILAGWLENEE